MSLGLLDDPFLRWVVEVLDVGEAACEANDSTSSMVWFCQPLCTLTMAYERRVFKSADSYMTLVYMSRDMGYA